TRPASPQTVIEIERGLPTLVATALPPPKGTGLEVVVGDARERLPALGDEERDALVLHELAGEATPGHAGTADFEREGLGRVAGQKFLAAQVRELEAAAAEVGVPGVWTLTDAQLLTRPSDGNMVLLAGGALASEDMETRRTAWLAAGPHPAAVLDPHETEDAFGAARA